MSDSQKCQECRYFSVSIKANPVYVTPYNGTCTNPQWGGIVDACAKACPRFERIKPMQTEGVGGMSATTDNRTKVAGSDSLCVDCAHLMPVVTMGHSEDLTAKCDLLPEANVTRVRVCEEYQHYLGRVASRRNLSGELTCFDCDHFRDDDVIDEDCAGTCVDLKKPARATDSACRRFVMAGNGTEAPNIERLPDPAPGAADLIRRECDALRDMLLEKNRRYGNSALEPVRVFSKADPVEQIRVRIDDKLSRLMRGTGVEDEDVELDLMGYLILLRVARRMQEATA